MNILLINHYAGSIYHGMEYRPYYFAVEWIKNGHTVTIITSSFSHLRSAQPRCKTPVVIENVNGIQYIWLQTLKYHGNGFRRILNMLSFAAQLRVRSLPIKKLTL